MKSKFVIWTIGTVLLIALFIPGYLFPGDVLKNIPAFSEGGWERPRNSLLADPVYQFEPWRDFSKKELFNGRFPLWNDLNGNGAPLLANFQSAVFYPLTLLYYLLPEKMAINVIILLKVLFFFLFTFLYLTSLKVKQSISLLVAFIGSFVGFQFLWLHWPHTNVFLLFPLILFITEKIYQREAQPYVWYILLTITYGIAVFGGHPETLFHILVIHSFYIIFCFWNRKQIYLPLFFSIFLGFLLGAVQILPFLEYLMHSYVFANRGTTDNIFYLPVISFVLNFFPFLLGAPHLAMYRPITTETNFQESAGGYTGLIVLLSAVAGFVLLKKNFQEKFWFGVIICSWLLSYKIFPFWYVNLLPVLNISANHRFIAFAGLGTLILFALALQKIITGSTREHFEKILPTEKSFVLLFIVSVGLFVISFFIPIPGGKLEEFFPLLRASTLVIVLSTLLFFWILKKYLARALAAPTFILLLIIVLSTQTILLFYQYNPLILEEDFYPDTAVTKILAAQPRGNILEVGNPSLPANTNLKYDVSHAVNNDAIEVLWYRRAFNDAFPRRNHWGNPDSVEADALRKLYINYVISDYDIRLKKENSPHTAEQILPPILLNNPVKFTLTTVSGSVRQLRLRTATFNKINTCTLIITINEIDKSLYRKSIPCRDVRNNMFLTVSLPNNTMEVNKEYFVSISSNTAAPQNAVALWGDKKGRPFFEILHDSSTENTPYELLGKTKFYYIWKILLPNIQEGIVSNRALYRSPQKISYKIEALKPSLFEVPVTYFPGWQGYVNDQKVELKNMNPFIGVPVERGVSYIELRYRPYSFTVGLFISMLTLLGITVISVRNITTQIKIIERSHVYKDFFQKISIMSLKDHVFIIFPVLFVSIASYAIFASFLPLTFHAGWTTGINWYSVHGYPRQLDYFYFITGFLYVLFTTFISWVLIILKKQK